MSISIKGFGILNALESSVPNTIVPVGELSTYSMTFSTDKTTHTDPLKDGGRFVNFRSVLEDGSDYEIPPVVESQILDVIEAVSVFDNQSTVLEQFNAAMPGITDVFIGTGIAYNNQLIPTFVQYAITIESIDYIIKVWFSDQAFRNEYDNYEIRSANTFSPSALSTDFVTVKNTVSSINMKTSNEMVRSVANGDSYTTVETIYLTWVSPVDNSQTVQVPWTFVCYGPQASTQASMLLAIREYLLAGGETIEFWVAYFPELISVDTFIVFPRWEKPSITIAGLAPSLYSPSIDYGSIFKPSEVITTSLQDNSLLTHTMLAYKSIGLTIQGLADNSENSKIFTSKFPMFAAISVTGNNDDLNRIPVKTKNAIVMLERLVRVAENAVTNTVLPNDFTRETIGSVLFIVGTTDSTTFKVASRLGYMAAMEE